MSFSFIIEHINYRKEVPSLQGAYLPANWHSTIKYTGVKKACSRGTLSSLPEQGQFELNFGKLTEISKAKTKSERKFGESRGKEACAKKALRQKECSMFEGLKGQCHWNPKRGEEADLRWGWGERRRSMGSRLSLPWPQNTHRMVFLMYLVKKCIDT